MDKPPTLKIPKVGGLRREYCTWIFVWVLFSLLIVFPCSRQAYTSSIMWSQKTRISQLRHAAHTSPLHFLTSHIPVCLSHSRLSTLIHHLPFNRVIVHRLRNPKLPKFQNWGWTTFSTKNVIISETQNLTYGWFSLPTTHINNWIKIFVNFIAQKIYWLFCYIYVNN